MNRPVVGLLALGAVLVAIVLATRTREQRRGAAEPVVDEVPVAEESAAPEMAPVAEASLDTPRSPTPDALSPSQREAAPDTLADELARAHWVEGRVVFPAGTPLDEEAFVVARGDEFSDGRVQRALVEHDGHFRVAFAETTRRGSFALEARYLYLEQHVRWKRGEGAREPVVLEPRLGARIAGRLVLPPGVEPASVGGEVKLLRVERMGVGWFSSPRDEHDVGRDLAFEFGGLPADCDYRLVYEGVALLGVTETPVEAGRSARADIELELGAVVAGRVVDESGTGIAGIKVSAAIDPRLADTPTRSAESAADGAFRIAGLHAGATALVVQTAGYVDARHAVGKLETGDVREGIELVLRRGNAIAGHVQWPDGTPAEASLHVVSEALWSFGDLPYTGKERGTSAADGTFRITGLDAGPFAIEATAKRKVEVTEWSELLGRERTRNKAEWLRASAEHVAAGTSDLVLLLSKGHELAGRVVDDLGAPVRSCRVLASRLERVDRTGKAGGSVENADGTFRLDGLSPGDWELKASGEGYGESQPVRFSIPAAEPVVVTLPRQAHARGIVVDPDGNAVRDALVEVELTTGAFTRSAESTTTDELGVFALAELHGTVALTATAAGWAPSDRLRLELAPGEVQTDVVLRLNQGCRVTGEVRDRSGAALAAVDVSVSSWSTHYRESVPADDAGRFEFSGVPPGGMAVSVEMPDGFQIGERVTLAAGESAHVVLRPRSNAVRLHGRVVLGGEPLAGAQLFVLQDGGSGRASTLCDDAGRYELEIDGAGSYTVNVAQGLLGSQIQARVEVPAVEDFAFDIVRGLGSISGSVRDEDGRPIEDVRVDADPCDRQDSFVASSHAFSDREGRYELAVPAATYVVKAGGDSWRRESGTSYVEASVDDVVVEAGDAVRGIDLVLVGGGVLSGVVRSARPTRWSRVSIAPADGSAPARFLGGTGEDGHFRIEGVARGSWLVAAGSQSMLSRWERVDIAPGSESSVELELSPATWLGVRPRARDGTAVVATIRVITEGPTHEATLDGPELVYWVGPFHPGSYRVRAERDGRVTERTVEIAGGQERMELDFVLD